MVSRLDAMLELERRGKLPSDMQPYLDEARKRGLLPGGTAAAPKSAGQQVVEHIQQHGLPGQDSLAFADQFLENIPIVGKPIKEGLSSLRGSIGNALGIGTKEDFDQFSSSAVKGAPVAALAGNVAGNTLPMIPLGATALGGRALGLTGNVLSRIGLGGASSAALAGADTFVDSGGDFGEAGKAAMIGGAVGAGLPAVGKIGGALWGGVKKALSGAAAGVDDGLSLELKSAAHKMFEASDAAHVGVTDAAYNRFLGSLEQDLTKLRIGKVRDPKATDALEELRSAATQMQTGLPGVGGQIEIGDLHVLRQIAAKAAQSPEGRDSMLGSKIVDKLDDFMDQLTPADIAGGVDPTQATTLLKDGIATWHVARKLETLEDAIYRAKLAASGLENGLRNEFRRILKSDRLRQGFKPDEIAAMEAVAEGTPGANALKFIGNFGFGANNVLRGTAAFMGANALAGPAAGLAVSGISTGAKLAAEKMTAKAAGNALSRVASKAPNALGPTGALKAKPSVKTVTLRQLLDGGPRGALPAAAIATALPKPTVNIEVYGGAQ